MSQESLIDGLQIYLNRMSNKELIAFRKQLARRLPGFLEETYKAAMEASQPAYQQEKKRKKVTNREVIG